MKYKIAFVLALLLGCFGLFRIYRKDGVEILRQSVSSLGRSVVAPDKSLVPTKASPILRERLEPSEVENIVNQDEKDKPLIKTIFPNGELVGEDKLDTDTIARSFRNRDSEEIVRLYTYEELTSEKWNKKDGVSLSRSWIEGRLFAFSYHKGSEEWTNFYDASGGITKKIITTNGQQICIKYDLSEPVSSSAGVCKDDDFREYEDLKQE